MESNSACNHTSDDEIREPSSGSPICLSRVWLQIELDEMRAYYPLIIKITLSEKRRIAYLWKKEKYCSKRPTKEVI